MINILIGIIGKLQRSVVSTLVQVPFCEDESVQLFRVAFFRSDFLQNSYFSTLVQINCKIHFYLVE